MIGRSAQLQRCVQVKLLSGLQVVVGRTKPPHIQYERALYHCDLSSMNKKTRPDPEASIEVYLCPGDDSKEKKPHTTTTTTLSYLTLLVLAS